MKGIEKKILWEKEKEELLNVIGDTLVSSQSPEEVLSLIKMNINAYETYHRANLAKNAIAANLLHKRYMQRARELGLDISKFPTELNYLEEQN